MSQLYKFAEEACWDRSDRFRQHRKSVVFRVASIGKIDGIRVNETIRADFGVYYDPEDEYLIGLLTDLGHGIDWGRFVFWKRPDHNGIDVIDPADDRVVAHVVVNRGQLGSGTSGDVDMTNVVELMARRVEREE